MPRSRRRHHSRSKSRSRSHSHDRDRDAKRRKIDNYDSPHNRRSVSCEDIASKVIEETTPHTVDLTSNDENVANESTMMKLEVTPKRTISENESTKKQEITPKRTLSPRVLQKKAESEKRRLEKQKEREERDKKKQEEKDKIKEEKEKQKREKELQKMKEKQEKLEQKQKEMEQKQREKELKEEQKRKEREEKEQKRREKEEKEEQKRKEKEQERLKRQQEIDEKNKEKQKLEEQKQKAAAAFANFFVSKKTDANEGKPPPLSSSIFMPFEIKTDMRLAPLYRNKLSDNEKELLTNYLNCQENVSYLDELKRGKKTGKCSKTWPFDDSDEDVMIVENNLGETIIDEQKPKLEKVRVKFLKFHDNRRPPYYGTWRKKSVSVRARNPLAKDKKLLDYEVDSDDDWEEEEQGESLNGSDDEDKENDSENEYEEDNVFFVPHGHLSEDEVDDEETAKLDPECHKAKLKLLKNEFEEEMKSTMRKIQPRSIGCVWYNKEVNNVEDAIDTFLKPLAILTDGPIFIKKRSEINFNQSSVSSVQKKEKSLQKEHIPIFLQVIHGNVNNQKNVIEEFLQYMSKNGIDSPVSKRALTKQMKQLAQWTKCPDDGFMHNKLCWYVGEDIRKEYNANLSLPKK